MEKKKKMPFESLQQSFPWQEKYMVDDSLEVCRVTIMPIEGIGIILRREGCGTQFFDEGEVGDLDLYKTREEAAVAVEDARNIEKILRRFLTSLFECRPRQLYSVLPSGLVRPVKNWLDGGLSFSEDEEHVLAAALRGIITVGGMTFRVQDVETVYKTGSNYCLVTKSGVSSTTSSDVERYIVENVFDCGHIPCKGDHVSR